MKSNKRFTAITAILSLLCIYSTYNLYKSLKIKSTYEYSSKDMKIVSDSKDHNTTTKNEINNLDIVDIDLPFIETKVESTSDILSHLASSVFSAYHTNLLLKNPDSFDYTDLNYKDLKVLGGDRENFVVELNLDSTYLREDSVLIKKYVKGDLRPLFNIQLQIKAVNPYTYELVAIGRGLEKNLESEDK